MKAIIEPEIIRKAIKPFKEEVKLCFIPEGITLSGKIIEQKEIEMEEPPYFQKIKEEKEITEKIPMENILVFEPEAGFCCTVESDILKHISSPRQKTFKKVNVWITKEDNEIKIAQSVGGNLVSPEIRREFKQKCIV